MAEGSGNLEGIPQPEAPKQNPTETSKGFLGKMVHGAKEGLIAMGYASVPGGGFLYGLRRARLKGEAQMGQARLTAKPEPESRPYAADKQTATGVPEVFSKRPGADIINTGKNWPLFAAVVATLGPGIPIGSEQSIISDVAHGNYHSLIAKGLVLGLGAVAARRGR